MTVETQLAEFVCTLQTRDVSPAALRVLRHMLMAVSGTALAGAGRGWRRRGLRALLRERGGAPQASTLVFG